MNIKSFIISVICLSISLSMSAQIQKGYVKTLGRKNKPGVALGGVSVRVKGGHNAVLSGQDGKFAMQLVGKKPGDEYRLQQVLKQGYELNDMSVVGRGLSYSDKVPLTIVMVSSKGNQEEKQQIENNIYANVEKKYKKDLISLEKQKETNKITIEQYRQQIQELQDNFEKIQGLIEGLAEHYAHVDYDELDENEREIISCIENGELEKAAALINSVFNLADIDRTMNALERNMQLSLKGEELKEEALRQREEHIKQQDYFAEKYYQLYTIALARFENDSARYFITRRAELDETNVDWMFDVAEYLDIYGSDLQENLNYYEKILYHSFSSYGNSHPKTIKCYHNIAVCYNAMAQHNSANSYFKKSSDALKGHEEDIEYIETTAEHYDVYCSLLKSEGKIKETIAASQMALDWIKKKFDFDNELVANYVESVGGTYNWNEKYREALECFLRALKIYDKCNSPVYYKYRAKGLIGATCIALDERDKAKQYLQESLDGMLRIMGTENHPSIALTYKNISALYADQKNSVKAIEYIDKAIEITKYIYGEIHPRVAQYYSIKGNIYIEEKQFEKGIEYLQKALKIRNQFYGETHIEVANSYQSIAVVFLYLKAYDEAKTLTEKALNIYKKCLEGDSPSIAGCLHNLSHIYAQKGNYELALKYCQRTLDMKKRIYGERHSDIALTYRAMCMIYEKVQDYDKAIECWEKSLEIEKAISGENSTIVAAIYYGIGTNYSYQSNYSKAMECYKKALTIREKVLGLEHPDVATCYYYIGAIYSCQSNYSKALECYKKALIIREKVLGLEHPDVATCYNNIGTLYDYQSKYSKAMECYKKALTIREKVLGLEHPDVATCYTNIGTLYEELNNFSMALDYCTKALSIREKVLGLEHPDVATSYNNVGHIYCQLGEYHKSLEFYNKALVLFEKDSDLIDSYFATILNNVGNVYQ